TGSGNFSTIMASADLRSTFISALSDLVNTYCFDGLDFDWEFPASNTSGLAGNAVSMDDTQNFLTFFQELRANPATSKLILSAATSVHPWNDNTMQPSTNVTGFAEVLDWIQIMNYDIWGSWTNNPSPIGPNVPLNDSCAPLSQQMGSAVSGVAKWTAAGMPLDKIFLGVGAYGHSFGYTADTFTPYTNWTTKNKGDKWAGDGGKPPAAVFHTMDFYALIDSGFLDQSGAPMDGIQYVFDNCSQTAYVYDKTSHVVVSFDDAYSFQKKGQFIADSGLRGFGIGEAGGDRDDILLNAIRQTSMVN
ncbi:glycoside hydrolase family 18 protein, partial [Sphaerobolus stellatus SS14]